MVEAKELNGRETADFITGLAKSEGKLIEREAAEELVILCNASLSAIAQEVKKLSTYIGDRDSITLEDVKSSLPEVSSRIF